MSKQKHIHISLLLFSTGFFIMASIFFTFSFQKKMDNHTIESSFLFREQLSLEEKQYLQTHIAVKATQMEKMKQDAEVKKNKKRFYNKYWGKEDKLSSLPLFLLNILAFITANIIIVSR